MTADYYAKYKHGRNHRATKTLRDYFQTILGASNICEGILATSTMNTSIQVPDVGVVVVAE
jgi:hypothetical protein